MTRSIVSSTNARYLPVVFVVYNIFNGGVKKGELDPRSVHHVTLMRDTKNNETVADTIERLKDMYSVYNFEQIGTSSKTRKVYSHRMTQRFRILSQKESDAERNARRSREGLTVVESMDDIVAATGL